MVSANSESPLASDNDEANTERQTDVSSPFCVSNLVHSGPFTLVYRVPATAPDGPSCGADVAIKCPAVLPPPSDCLARLRNEFLILKGLPERCAGMRRAIREEATVGDDLTLQRYAVYLVWANGTDLKNWIRTHPPIPMPPVLSREIGDGLMVEKMQEWNADFLLRVQIAHGIASALRSLHNGGIAHNSIATENIIIDIRKNDEYDGDSALLCNVTLIDLGYASPFALSECDDEGERANDDLSALGHVIESLFISGNLPSVDRCIPRSVVALLHRLNGIDDNTPIAEAGRIDSYRTASAICEDLQEMLGKPAIFLFDPDPEEEELTTGPSCFPKNSKLYGRTDETEALLDAYDRVAKGGRSETVLIRGASGTGKSKLVQQVRDRMLAEGGYFIDGKYDQMHINEPYFAYVHAFSELCGLILMQDLATVRMMAASIRGAVGSEGKVLTDIIPQLAAIIGVQSRNGSNISAVEARNRLHFIFRMFIRAISKPAHPVVLFLDDLQWADASSLDLMRVLVTDPSNSCFLFVGCYRDSEVMSSHPLATQLHEIEAMEHVALTSIVIRNLDEGTLNTMVSETLRLPSRLTQPLARKVHRKTLGNPLFVVHFLRSLCDHKILQFSPIAMQWTWDDATVCMAQLSDNVAELMAAKIKELPASTQKVLKVAAGIGAQFDISTLQRVLALQENTMERDHGILLSAKSSDKPSDMAKILGLVQGGLLDSTATKGLFRFSHDRIQQAAYSLIPGEERSIMHLRIGRLIRQDSKGNDITEMFFRSVDHLNRGAICIHQENEKVELAELNYQAGEKALLSSASVPAAAYLRSGINLLGSECWERNYHLTLHLSTRLAEAEYCNGNFDEVEHISEDVINHAKILEEKFQVYLSLIKSLGAQGRMHEAIDLGFLVLSALGEPFPKAARKRSVLASLLKTKLMLTRVTDASISELPAMTAPYKIAAMKMLITIFALVYISKPQWAPLIAFRMVQLSLRYGLTKESPYSFMTYGVIMCGMGDIQGGLRFGNLSLLLVDKCDAREWTAHVHAPCYAAIKHWSEPIRETLQPFLRSHRAGMEVGDTEYASYSLYHFCHFAFECGLPLQALEKDMSSYCKQMAECGQDTALNLTLPIWQTVLNLMGRSADPLVLTGDAMNQDKLCQEYVSSSNKVALYTVYVQRLFLGYLFGDIELAASMAEKSRDVAQATPALLLVLTQGFYDGLTSFALARETKEKKWFSRGCRALKKMKKWVIHSPENCLHKLLVLKAEKADVKGKKRMAQEMFDAAIAAANSSGFIQEEALAYERAGFVSKRYSEQGKASHYFSRAHDLYMEWGGQAKAEQLDAAVSSCPAVPLPPTPLEGGADMPSPASVERKMSGMSLSGSMTAAGRTKFQKRAGPTSMNARCA